MGKAVCDRCFPSRGVLRYDRNYNPGRGLERESRWDRTLMDSMEAGARLRAGASAAGQKELERLARQMYEETFRPLDDLRMRRVVKHKITAMFGPPMVRPDVALVSFQGGGGDAEPSQRTWPPRLLYLDDDFAFGKTLRRAFDAACLHDVLERQTVALATCFPEAPESESEWWTVKTGPGAEWREFSSSWTRRMLVAMRPQAVVVFGAKASKAMEMEDIWQDTERDSRGWLAFGRGEIEQCPAVYCQHLSHGWKRECVEMSLREVERLTRGGE